MPPVELQSLPSAIAGRGLFTTAPVPVGTPVLDDAGALNHSCDPSLWFTDGALTARRDLAAGDELTVDYATLLSQLPRPMHCHCGTYRCRQVIDGDDWTIPQLQQRYAGHWAPRLQQLISASL